MSINFKVYTCVGPLAFTLDIKDSRKRTKRENENLNFVYGSTILFIYLLFFDGYMSHEKIHMVQINTPN